MALVGTLHKHLVALGGTCDDGFFSALAKNATSEALCFSSCSSLLKCAEMAPHLAE